MAAPRRDPAANPPRRVRHLFFALGWTFFVLGVLGFVLPVMPGTVFMILALWAFSRSSRRFHDWLYTHRWFGPPLQRWTAYRVVPWSARVIAYGSMMTSLITTAFFLDVPPAVPLSIALISIAAILYISRCPSRLPRVEDRADLAGEIGDRERLGDELGARGEDPVVRDRVVGEARGE